MARFALRTIRSQLVLILVVLLSLAAAAAITLLEQNVDASRQAQAQVETVELHLLDLENAPIKATRRTAASVGVARRLVTADGRAIAAGLRSLRAGSAPPQSLLGVNPAVREVKGLVARILAGEVAPPTGAPPTGRPDRLLAVVDALQLRTTSAMGLLTRVARVYDQRAGTARRQAMLGSIATILVLLSIFIVFYRRAHIARAENVRLLLASRDEAVTDPLTGIGNRRAFKRDLEARLLDADSGHELLVAMFDLDGFKQHNDTFGHAAGDALLARLAGRLEASTAGTATAYRMGGDEFCLLARTDVADGQRLVRAAVAALSDSGEGWQVGCSWGVAWMPSEATRSSEALHLADGRMYAQKSSRVGPDQQATAALVQVLVEQDIDLSNHISRVAQRASATARALGLAEHEVSRIGLAAQLHDIGKTAIPMSILSKPGPLNDQEWEFMRRHTVIGERIIAAAPALAHTAQLVRSSHERFDGTGYPDQLRGSDIPFGSRIIAVCDAFDAMTSSRSYRDAMGIHEAAAELRRCSGTQFDPDVVEAFCAIELGRPHPAAAEADTGIADTLTSRG